MKLKEKIKKAINNFKNRPRQISKSETGVGFINMIKCPFCGYETKGADKVYCLLEDDGLRCEQFDGIECRECYKEFSVNVEECHFDSLRGCYRIETWVWQD